MYTQVNNHCGKADTSVQLSGVCNSDKLGCVEGTVALYMQDVSLLLRFYLADCKLHKLCPQ